MQYTEEHYAEMYNNLPEGLKDLVLSGRLAILVSAIGSRHGLSPDQVADLEPAVEDVCLGLITKDELVDNIQKSVEGVDTRVANRIAAETELEILKPFEAELLISRKQKEDLDEKIGKKKSASIPARPVQQSTSNASDKKVIPEPQNVSDHAQIKKVTDWYSNDKGGETEDVKRINTATSFDWDKDFAAKKEEAVTAAEATPESTTPTVSGNIEVKLDKLTESINNLVNTRFGSGDKKEVNTDTGLSSQMQDLIKRLEKAEKENEENKKLIKSLQGVKPVDSIFGNITAPAPDANKIQIDKQRKVEISHTGPIKEKAPDTSGNIQITSVSKSIPISSTVSKDTVNSIVETKNKVTPTTDSNMVAKKTLSLEELIKAGDEKIKQGIATDAQSMSMPHKSATLVFPSMGETEKKIDIKSPDQKDSLKQILLDDLEFIKKQNAASAPITPLEGLEKKEEPVAPAPDQNLDNKIDLAKPITTYDTNPFKEELIPTTKEDRMKALQDKIKSLNKGVSVGGKTNIAASGLDPYRL